MRRTRSAFTLVELLVVVSIIVVLIAMLVPAMESAVEVARRAKCATNLRVLHGGIYQYAMDNRSEVIPCAGRAVQISIGAKGYDGHRRRIGEDLLVDWPAALASVGLATPSPVDVGGGVMQHQPLEMWGCPTRGFTSAWNGADAIYVGYQYLGGIEEWSTWGYKFQGKERRESASPVRIIGSKSAWVLAADTTARIDFLWGGNQASPFTAMPSHPSDRSLRPAGGNQVHLDGSAVWIKFDDMMMITSWGKPALSRMMFFQQTDLNGWKAPEDLLARNVPGNP